MTGPAPSAVEGWFRADPPALLGRRCDGCGDVAFPPGAPFCANPACDGTQFTPTELSTSGTIWSYTDARYQPPPPYVSRHDPFVPFAIAAVELAEGLVVLGQVVERVRRRTTSASATSSTSSSSRSSGRPAATCSCGGGGPASIAARRNGPRRDHRDDVCVIGVGMHPWGKWGRPFIGVRSGGRPGRARRRRRRLDRRRLPRRRRDRSQRLRRLRRRVDVRPRARLERGPRGHALRRVRRRGRLRSKPPAPASSPASADVALVVGADTTPKGFLAPNAGERWDDPDWLRFRAARCDEPCLLRPLCPAADGPVRRHPRRLRAREGEERSRTAWPIRMLGTARP